MTDPPPDPLAGAAGLDGAAELVAGTARLDRAPDPLAGAAGLDGAAELASKVAAALERLGRARRHQRQAAATRHGLTPLQLDLLTTLVDGPPPEPTVGHLAAEVAVTQPTASDSLRALAGKGLVARRPDPTDRRVTTVALTAAGRRVADDVARTDDDLAGAIGALPVAAQEAMFESLLTVIARLVDTGAIDVARTCLTCRHHRHENGAHRCALLDVDLPASDLRVNCPDHRAA